MINFPFIQGLFVAIIGWLSGGLVNYLSDSLPNRNILASPVCKNCNTYQPWVAYYLGFKKCSHCKTIPPKRMWLVNITYVLLSIWLWIYPPDRLGYILGLVLAVYFGIVTVIDIEHHLILHTVSAIGALLGLGVGIYLHGFYLTLIGGIAGFSIMLILYFLGFAFVKILSRLRHQQINEVALGFGDVNLSGVLGLLLGWPGILAGLVFAIIIGGVISIIYMVIMTLRKQYRADMALPYGPFLVASAILLIFFKDLLV